MPGEDLIWRGKKIGEYGLVKEESATKSEYAHGKPGQALLSNIDAQTQVNAYLESNPEALAKLYGIPASDDVEAFLEEPDPIDARVKFKEAFEAYMAQPKTENAIEVLPKRGLFKFTPKALVRLARREKSAYQAKNGKPSTTMREFLGSKELFELYQKAVKEEVNSKSYKNAVFLKSVSDYKGETLETPVYIVAGGPSGAGKSFLKEPSVAEALKYSAKKMDNQGQPIEEGNKVISIDNGIARSTLQVGKTVLQYSFSKGYKEISDYNEVTKASAKSKIKAAAAVVGLSMYKPKTYPKPRAYKTVLKMLKKHDRYHGKKQYDVIATNIQANKETVRHQGMSRAQFQGDFKETEIDLNLAEMPAESKRYGRLLANLDLLIGYWKNKSFHTGQKKSMAAAKQFAKKGIPIIEIDSTDRILVMFKPGDENNQLVRVYNEKAGSSEAFITTRQALIAWNLKSRPKGGKDDFRAFEKDFEKANPPKSTIEMNKTGQEMHELREAYVKFFNDVKKNNPQIAKHLSDIKDFNEFLRVTDIQLKPEERKKLLAFINSPTADKTELRAKIDQLQFHSEKTRIPGYEWSRETVASFRNNQLNTIVELPVKVSSAPLAQKEVNSGLSKDQIDTLLKTSALKPDMFSYEKALPQLRSPNDLLLGIKAVEKQLLDAKGNLVEINGKKVRVFLEGNPDFKIRTQDFYARGLQFASAMLKIQDLEGNANQTNSEEIRACIEKYTEQMKNSDFDNVPTFEKAEQHTLDFMGIMSHLLSESREDKNHNKAFEDIKKATELYSMIEPDEEAVCTVRRPMEEGPIEIQLSERLTFDQPVHSLQSVQSETWYKQAEQKYGNWFNRFIAQNYPQILQKSPPCTTRDMPNPSNAWKERSIELTQDLGENLIQREKQHTRVAITAPFDIKDKKERVRIAAESMKTLLNETELENQAQAYINRWGPLLKPGEPIEIYTLHQTLLSPLAVGPDKKMMDVKRQSNELVKEHLANLPPKSINGHPVSFKLGQVNNCVNIWHPISTPTKKEKADSNYLVTHVAKLLNGLETKGMHLHSKDVLNTTIEFLNNTSSKRPTKQEEDAFADVLVLIEYDPRFSPEQKKDLSLTIQAAINLKRLNHEAPSTSVARRFVQYLKGGGVIARFGDVFISPRNNQTAKSVYELILADQLGMGLSGCKSAFDRAGEVNNHKQAMLRQFNQEGVLFDALSSDAQYRQYLTDYFDPIEKAGHQNKIMAATDRVGADKKWELKTDSYLRASANDKKKIKIASEFRKVTNPLKGKKGKKRKLAEKQLVEKYFEPKIEPKVEPTIETKASPAIELTTIEPNVETKLAERPRSVSEPLLTNAPSPTAAPVIPAGPPLFASGPAFLSHRGSSPSVGAAPPLNVFSASPGPSNPPGPAPVANIPTSQVRTPNRQASVPREAGAASESVIDAILGRLQQNGREVGPSMSMRNTFTITGKSSYQSSKYTISANPSDNTLQYHIPVMNDATLEMVCKDAILLAKPPTLNNVFDLSTTPEKDTVRVKAALEKAAGEAKVAISFSSDPAPSNRARPT